MTTKQRIKVRFDTLPAAVDCQERRIEECDRFKPFSKVTDRDERWQFFGNRSLNAHHSLIDSFVLGGSVPAPILQHYENARNAWLYSFFSYRLLQIALFQVHLAGETAIRERAKREGVNPKKKLVDLLDLAIERRWLLDASFEVTTERRQREVEYLEMLRFMGVSREPFVGPIHEQDYVKGLVSAFRQIKMRLLTEKYC